MSQLRTSITLTFIDGIATPQSGSGQKKSAFECTDLSKVTVREEQVYFCLPGSNAIGIIEDELGRPPNGVPFATRREAEDWLKAWVGKEIAKLQDKVREYSEELQVVLGNDVSSIDDGVHE
jgi:hypothetical protein